MSHNVSSGRFRANHIVFLFIYPELYRGYLAYLEPFATLLLTLLLFIVKSLNNFKTYNTIRNFESSFTPKNKQYLVCRQDVKQKIDASKLVVGDILIVKPGTIIPCDSYLIRTKNELVIKENEFTSLHTEASKLSLDECLEIRNKYAEYKYDSQSESLPSPIVISGSKVISGKGKLLVVCVGRHCVRG